MTSNTSNTELNPICHLLALLGTHHILHVSRIRANLFCPYNSPHAKLTHKNYLNEYYFYDDEFTKKEIYIYNKYKKLSGKSLEALFCVI
jgi:hypothetical protein